MFSHFKSLFLASQNSSNKARAARALRCAVASSFVEVLEQRALLSATLPIIPPYSPVALSTPSLQSFDVHPAIAGSNLSPAVGTAPTIASADHASLFVGIGGTFTIITQATPVAALSETGALPSGVSFTDNLDGTATFSVAPSAVAAIINVTLTAANGNAPDATQSFTLTLVQPNVLTVSNLLDAGPGSLREAMTNANLAGGQNLIKFAPGLTGTISPKTKLPDIANDLIIVGTGITVNGKNAAATVFTINTGFTCLFINMTITGGVGNTGGGISNAGILTVMNSNISSNTSTQGGGIFSTGELTVINSTLSSNRATINGGGAIFTSGNARVIDSTLNNNSGGTGINSGGGGIAAEGSGTLKVTNCTIANNTADFGAGISNNGPAMELTDCTIVQNKTISSDGGVTTFSPVPGKINGTIIARNSEPDLSSGPEGLVGSNDLIGDGSDLDVNSNPNAVLANSLRGNLANPLNPQLGSLASNGGPTATMAETSASPGIAHGANFPVLDTSNGDITATDQRGFVRPQAGIDIGAFQLPPAGAATRLLIEPIVSTMVAGGTISSTQSSNRFAVKLINATGHIDTSNFSNVTITIQDASGVPVGNPVTVQAFNGAATFHNLSITQAGSFTLVATDAALSPGKSNKFTVTADTSTPQLVLVHQPAATVVGAPLAPSLVVEIQDQFSNIITSDHSKVTLSVSSGPGILGGTTTVTANKGVATFSKATLSAVGSYTLAATDATLLTNNSIQFSQTISQATTTVTAPHPAASYKAGKPINLTAAFKSNAPNTIPFTGNATIQDQNNTVLGTATVSANGTIKFALSGLLANTYTCTLNYPGDTNHTAVTSTSFTLLVKP